MVKFLFGLLAYAATLTAALVAIPLLAWRFELVTFQNFVAAVVLAPASMWSVFYLHKKSFEYISAIVSQWSASLSVISVEFAAQLKPQKEIQLLRAELQETLVGDVAR